MSNINPININGAFPIAGQDNDSQGFRDNFTNIRTNFTFTKTEIEDLQAKVVLKQPLSGNSATNNNFNGTTLVGATTHGFTETVFLHPSPVSGQIDFALGDFQKIATDAGSVTLSFTGWPTTNVFAKVRLMIEVMNLGDTITFPPEVTVGLNKVPNIDVQTRVMSPPNPGVYVFEVSTHDGGYAVMIVPLITP